MGEAEWLDERAHPQRMMWCLRNTRVARTKAGRRKLRLFACACCRQFWDHLWDDRLRRAVEVAESFAEGRATRRDLEDARRAAEPLARSAYQGARRGDPREGTAAMLVAHLTEPAAFDAAHGMTLYEFPLAGYCGDQTEEHAIIRKLLRDVLANPFRPEAFERKWSTSNAVALAEQMYESRDFGAMPILADALQDAGCDSEDVLSHCRGESPHVRGCWVVDLVLGKA